MRTPVLDVFRPGFHRLCRVYFGLELKGIDHIPATGPVIIVPNHQSFADPPLVTIPIRRPVHYMAWRRLFEVPLLGWLIRRLRAFPVEIESSDPRATREAVRLLQAGEAVMIFPEGGRTHDGRIQRFKLGAFRLAVLLGVPVLPVTITGGHAAWPPGRAFPRRGRMTITYHSPLFPDRSTDAREAARDLCARTLAVIASALPPSTSAAPPRDSRPTGDAR